MPIDPSIALGVKPPQSQSGPLDVYKESMGLRDLMQRGRINDINEQSATEGLATQKLDRRQREKKAADEEAQTQIIKTHLLRQNPDGTYDYDHDAVEGAMVRAGLNPMQYHEQRLKIQESTDKAITEHLKLNSEKAKKLGAAAQTVLNAPPDLRPGVYSFTLKQAVASGLVDPEQAKAIPPEYDGETSDAMLQQLADLGQDNPFEVQLKRQEEKRRVAGEERAVAGEERNVAEDARKSETQVLDVQKRRQDLDRGKMAQNEIELEQRAAAGDKMAQAALKNKANREISVDTAKAKAKAGAEMEALTGGGATGLGPTDRDTTGPDENVLSKLDRGLADTVRRVAEYKQDVTPYQLARSPYWRKVAQLAGEYDHGFDPSNYDVRKKSRVDFTSGKSAQGIKALNTVTQHMDTLDKAIDALDNFGGDNAVSKAGNYVKNAAKDKKAQNNFNIAADAVANELTAAFRGSGGAEADIQAWRKSFDVDASKDVQKSAIPQVAKLLAGRIEAFYDQYEKTMGRPADFNILSTNARATLKKLGIDATQLDPPKTVKPTAPPAGGGEVKVQQNKTTGAYRWSDDGGKTWHNGRPQ